MTDPEMSRTKLMSKPIYLIVATATSPPMGIGLKGSLPWTSIRSDMSFFRKVTTEARSFPTSSDTGPSENSRASDEFTGLKSINAVIMGRKTWESIPPKFRPLSDRINIVVTRKDARKLGEQIHRDLQGRGLDAFLNVQKFTNHLDTETTNLENWTAVAIEPTSNSTSTAPTSSSNNTTTTSSARSTTLPKPTPSAFSPILITSSLPELLAQISHQPQSQVRSYTHTHTQSQFQSLTNVLQQYKIDKQFCIGGAEIYNHFLSHPEVYLDIKILQTQVRRLDGSRFECDTFFPAKLVSSSDTAKPDGESEDKRKWREVGDETVVEQWIGGIGLPQHPRQGQEQEQELKDQWFRDEKAAVDIRVVGWESS